MLRFRAVYITTAVILLNAACLFVVANIVAAALLRSGNDNGAQTYKSAWLIDAYGMDTLARNYPGMSPADLETFLHETSNWIQQYEPFTGLRPAERHDHFITISAQGFRPTPHQAAWPPPADGLTVFLFGGSTTMGAGVPDDATVAAHLQNALVGCTGNVHIYNFGRGFYFSTQERILFEQLLLAGHRPAVAIFIDGLNDFYFADGNPQFTTELSAFMKREAGLPTDPPLTASLAAAARQLPLTRAAARLGLIPPAQPIAFGSAPPASGNDDERVTAVLGRWDRNRTLIQAAAAANGIGTAFVWQPVPTYGYDASNMTVFRKGVDLFGAHRLSGVGYRAAANRYQNGQLADVLWLGEMQRDRRENLYVDAVHYTSAFSREIADQIADHLKARKLIPCPNR